MGEVDVVIIGAGVIGCGSDGRASNMDVSPFRIERFEGKPEVAGQ